MMAGKVVGLGFEIISKLDSYFLMTVTYFDLFLYHEQLLMIKKYSYMTTLNGDIAH